MCTRHNPEFTMLEFYQAYATYEDLMTFTEELLKAADQALAQKMPERYAAWRKDRPFTLELFPFKRVTMAQRPRGARDEDCRLGKGTAHGL